MNHRTENEQRLLGASFVLSRNTKRGMEVLLIKDKPKIETPAGLEQWFTAAGEVLSFPGGGRGITNSGKPETREQTLQQETDEEMGLLLSLKLLSQGQVQKHPFLLGQRNIDMIHQIGVTSSLFSIDQLGQLEQRYIEEYIAQDKALWTSFDKLVLRYITLLYKVGSFEITIRPHAFLTAYIWNLDLVEKWSKEAIGNQVDRLNMITRKFLVAQSNLLTVPIRNGAFDNEGKILLPSQLSEEDSVFLYGIL